MKNIKAFIEYDGTNYHGWQIQKNTRETIQQYLQEALTKINKTPVKVTAAGRTDAGVHAQGQVINFKLDVPLPAERVPMALNSLLPEDIICKGAKEVPDSFHARYDARRKLYRYRILNSRIPSVFVRNFVLHFIRPLKLKEMQKGASHLVGTHDFASFKASGSPVEDTVRTIERLDVFPHGQEYWIEVKGDGFLYNMVRIIVGTLLEVGVGKLSPEDVEEILAARDRQQAGYTAPAKGLTLVRVFY